jgi:hypothetical protein
LNLKTVAPEAAATPPDVKTLIEEAVAAAVKSKPA